MDLKTVLYEVESNVATVTLNRPEALNALNPELHQDLGRALDAAVADASVRVLVLTGAGRGFCAGGDIKAMAAKLAAMASGSAPPNPMESLHTFHELMTRFYELPKPVVAAIHGPAVGAGMSLALACDLRVASEDAVFSQAFVKIGLSPDGGSTWLLPRAVGASRAAYLAMTGETINAKKALEWGAIHDLVENGQHLAKAREWAARLAAYSPHALRELKALLQSSEGRSFAAQLQAEAEAQMRNVTTAEFRAAVTAFVSRK